VLHFLAVVGNATLGLLLLVAIVLDLSIVAALVAARPSVVLPLSRAILSTISVLTIIYVVAVPLYRRLPRERFVRYLESLLGRESYLLAACELSDGKFRRSDMQVSGILLEELGQLALQDLEKVPRSRTAGVNRLFVLSAALLAVIGATIASSMIWSAEVGKGLNLMLTRPAQERRDSAAGPVTPSAGVPTPDVAEPL